MNTPKQVSVAVLFLLTLFTPPAYSQEVFSLEASVDKGTALAREAINTHARLTNERQFKGEAGLLIAEGDSWFDYPILADVLDQLRWEHDYRVASVARAGHTLDSMAYDSRQLGELTAVMKKNRDLGRMPKAILLSGGGNDLVGDEFVSLLNHKESNANRNGQPLNDVIVNEVINVRLKSALVSWLSTVTELNRAFFGNSDIPILIHGYADAIPDGRGVFWGWVAGPWMEPSFTLKGYDDLKENSEAVADLIGRFNAMLKTIPNMQGLEHVKYIPTIDLLDSRLATYKNDWANELHPTRSGFKKVAKRFHDVIQGKAP